MFFRIRQGADQVRFEISSERRALELAHETCLGFLMDHGARNAVPVHVVLDELLKNAVKHGNGSDPGKHVKGRLAVAGTGVFELTISDEGSGFAHEELNVIRHDDPRAVERRGLIVAKALSSLLEFSDGGRCVTAQIRVRETPGHDGACSGSLGVLWGSPASVGDEPVWVGAQS